MSKLVRLKDESAGRCSILSGLASSALLLGDEAIEQYVTTASNEYLMRRRRRNDYIGKLLASRIADFPPGGWLAGVFVGQWEEGARRKAQGRFMPFQISTTAFEHGLSSRH